MQRRYATQHPKSTDETDESEAMVAMQMTDENCLQLSETNVGATQGNLRTLPAIYHETFASYLNKLRGGKMMERGQRAAAT
jgi:hypothetical protein